MSNTLSKILIFASGAAIGSVVTWKIITDRYSQIIEEELESIKNEILEELEEEDESEDDDIQEEVESSETDKTMYSEIIKKGGYRNYSNRTPAKQVAPEEEEKEEEEIEDMGRPYVVSPDDFDEHDDYEAVTLVYYSDKVLTDEDDNVIEDVEGMVGEESLNHFGEYEDDSVFVRNDERKTDYEILLDERRFADVFTRR